MSSLQHITPSFKPDVKEPPLGCWESLTQPELWIKHLAIFRTFWSKPVLIEGSSCVALPASFLPRGNWNGGHGRGGWPAGCAVLGLALWVLMAKPLPPNRAMRATRRSQWHHHRRLLQVLPGRQRRQLERSALCRGLTRRAVVEMSAGVAFLLGFILSQASTLHTGCVFL